MRRPLILSVALALLAVAPAHAAARASYLALGDSDAFGFQNAKYHPGVPASAFATGYADVIAARRTDLTLVNLACPGDSFVTFMAGPCPYRAAGEQLHRDYATSQLTAALAFLLAHGTALVTLTLASNDVVALVHDCQSDFACAQQRAPVEIAKLSARLATVLVALRLAAPGATIVVTGPYDPNPQPIAQQTHPLYLALDRAMQITTTRLGARYARLFDVFDADLCRLTSICATADAHPSDAGHRKIADIVLEQHR